MKSLKDVQQIKALIAEGKKKGFLTFEELNKALPKDVNSPEQVEEIISILTSWTLLLWMKGWKTHLCSSRGHL